MRLTSIKYALFAIALIALFTAVRNQLDDVRQLGSTEALFTGELAETTRLEREMLIFTQSAAEYVTESDHIDRDKVLLNFDVLWSRVNTQYSKNFMARVESLEQFAATLHDLSGVLQQVDPLVKNLKPGDTATLARIMDAFRPYVDPVADMTSIAYAELQQRSLDHVQLQRRAMASFNHLQLLFMLFTLVAVGFLVYQLRRGEILLQKLRAREGEIRALAARDHLTGLSNRREFDHWLANVDIDESQNKLHLLLVDLDGFKSVNDTQGHMAGDLVLQEVSRRLSEIAGSSIRLARIGGDEFALLVADTHEKAATVAASIVSTISEPMRIEGTPVKLGACVGISTLLGHHANSKQLVLEADTALYHAKSDGGGSFAFYTEALNVALAAAGQSKQATTSSVKIFASMS